MEHIAQGKRSDTLGFPHSRVSAPCKGKSFNPLCYSYLIAKFVVLKWNIACVFCSRMRHSLKLLPLQGATAPTRDPQGAASLALGYVLHWAFSPPLLNPKTSVPYALRAKRAAYAAITTKQHNGTIKAIAMLAWSAISPISTGAMAPPTIDIIKNDEARLVCWPTPFRANANMVGNMMLSHK